MTEFVSFPDPMLAAIEILRASLPANSVNVGTVIPGKESPDLVSVPYVAVRSDGEDLRYPIVSTATLRVLCYGSTEFDSLALANDVQATLLSYEGGEKIRSISSLRGPIPTTDPESGIPFSFFLVAARLRPNARG
jgi:hypothetical protein